MKWPKAVMLIRHDTSEYNLLKEKKKDNSDYKRFLLEWKKDPHSLMSQAYAKLVQEKFSLGTSDAKTELADKEGKRAFETGKALSEGELPDIIFVSPYKRTQMTLHHLKQGWPALKKIKVLEEDRVREQEHGLSLLCNDWRVFFALNPDQYRLHEQEGSYWYRFPQGESVPDMRNRLRSFTTTLIRDWAEKKILVISHHLCILAFRANMERFGPQEFMRIDKEEKPINCGVTLYQGYPDQGKDGHLLLEYYNRKYYK